MRRDKDDQRRGRSGHALGNIMAGIATEVGFSLGLTLALCLMAYAVAFLTR